MAKKARELPGSIQHLPAYIEPDPSRIRYSDVWQRANDRWRTGLYKRVWVEIHEMKKGQ